MAAASCCTSELRKGTDARVMLPGYRVLRAMVPLQPLGQETHRLKGAGAAPAAAGTAAIAGKAAGGGDTAAVG